MTHVQHVFVIAEAGSNWRMGTPDRDRQMARALVDVAFEAGADAVKFQTYRADSTYVADAGSTELPGRIGATDARSTRSSWTSRCRTS